MVGEYGDCGEEVDCALLLGGGMGLVWVGGDRVYEELGGGALLAILIDAGAGWAERRSVGRDDQTVASRPPARAPVVYSRPGTAPAPLIAYQVVRKDLACFASRQAPMRS